MLIRTKQIIAQSLTEWVEQRASSKGAALAFYTLFSMTPILVLAIALAGYFFGAQAAQGEMVEQMRTLAGPNGAQAIQAMLAAAQDPASGLIATLIASVLLLVGATSVFAELKGSLDEMWGTGKRRRSTFTVLVRTRLLAFGLVLVLAFLLLISLVVSAGLALLERYAGAWASSSGVLSALSWLISFGVIAFLFAVIYKMLPDVQLSWHDVWIGALVTAGLFALGKQAIGLYLGNGAVASSFGAAGSVVALLAWVYYSAQIFFLGAQFTRQYALCCGSLQDKREPTALVERAREGALS
ncbi:MAG TPA: YihY/virulence factor BrkB family protein [Burkholderiales bacterium]|nr:YihY/virulence factor BrkB family protein [Burkholderiales bacterium]